MSASLPNFQNPEKMLSDFQKPYTGEEAIERLAVVERAHPALIPVSRRLVAGWDYRASEIEALRILRLVESHIDEMLEAVLSANDCTYQAVRGWVMDDPAHQLELTDPARYLQISQWRMQWAIRGWKAFFYEHVTRPSRDEARVDLLVSLSTGKS
jgi:hypothetical protein